MKKKTTIVFTVMALVLSVVLAACSGASAENVKGSSAKDAVSSESGNQSIEGEWEMLTFDEVIRRSSVAFIGTVTEISELSDNLPQRKIHFHVDEDLYGNLKRDELDCYALAMDSALRYEPEGRYLMIATCRSMLFYEDTQYYPVSDIFFDVENGEYTLFGKPLGFSDREALAAYVKEVFMGSNTPTEAENVDGTWETADFIAEITPVYMIHAASDAFSGNSYLARIEKMIRGNEDEIVMTEAENKLFTVTLLADRTTTGKTYKVGFSLKGGASSVYVQEGMETVEEVLSE